MNGELKELPIGVQSFNLLRGHGCLYVDKTSKLLGMAKTLGRYFLARPRRFGKSLTISTLDAMFSGKAEFFKGLAAEEWVTKQAGHPSPVLRLDMSILDCSSVESLDRAISDRLQEIASDYDLAVGGGESCGDTFRKVIRAFFKSGGPVVVLIDEYDRPMLDNIGNLEAANAMRQVLRSFYSVLKGCDDYLRFVMLTGISKFSKTGVFSAMNNLQDISLNKMYGDIVGYTQAELEENFGGWIDGAADALSLEREELLDKIKNYYDGFCFDGETRIYNPFSMLNFFSEKAFRNYWYVSGSPSFIVDYMRQHAIRSPEEYRHIEVPANFMDAQEIERASAESFLCQSGYLTIEKRNEQSFILDYPNREVLDSLSQMYLEYVYHVGCYVSIGSDIWRALKARDLAEVVELYNTALAGIPYDDYVGQGENWYRALFLMLLRGAGVTVNGEVHTNRGRPDVVALFPEQVTILEFKYAKGSSEIDSKRAEGKRQIIDKNYAKPYDTNSREVISAVVIIDGEKREAVL